MAIKLITKRQARRNITNLVYGRSYLGIEYNRNTNQEVLIKN